MLKKNLKTDKNGRRLRRARRARMKIRSLKQNRLTINRTPRHIYAQLISPDAKTVLAAASTTEADVRKKLSGKTGNVEAAKTIGQLIAERAKGVGVETVAFDRGGFLYHGRVKALAEAAREAGLKF
ncbi:MAG: 50S ribosomal protein L18 [Gammaproteobacteria bacterium]|nr:50S ribosomal protein L18 [Gammaproteobacteria bacterium]